MWYFRALHRHIFRLLQQGLGNEKNARVLDAGCGTGGLLRRLHEREPHWHLSGVDVSPLACELARQRTAAEIREASVTALPFDDSSFDAIVAADVIYQLDRPGEAVAEFTRCLRPGGFVVMNVAAYQWLWSYHDEAVGSKHRFRRGEVTRLMEAAGLVPVSSTYWNTLPFPLIVAKRKLLRSAGRGDVQLYPKPVEAILNALMAAEHFWLEKIGRMPFGSSVLAMGRKGEGGSSSPQLDANGPESLRGND